MDAREAREHLEMVDRILAQAKTSRPFRPYAQVLIAFGIAVAVADAGFQWGLDGHGYAVAIAGAVLILAAWAYMMWGTAVAKGKADRITLAEVQKSRALGAVWLGVFAAEFAQPHLFSGWACVALWSLGAAIAMFTIGFSGDRRALLAGFALVGSIVAANFFMSVAGYVLALGFVLGYLVPGVLYITSKDGGEACG